MYLEVVALIKVILEASVLLKLLLFFLSFKLNNNKDKMLVTLH